MRAVSERSALSIRMLGNMSFLATDTVCEKLYLRACRLHLRCCSHKNWPRPPIYITPSRKMPPFLDACATSVAVRALPRVSAQLSTSARGSWSLAQRGVGIVRAGQLRWECSLGCVLLRARGHPGAPRGCFVTSDWAFRLAGSQLKFFERRKNGERAVERTNGWVGGVFTDSPKT